MDKDKDFIFVSSPRKSSEESKHESSPEVPDRPSINPSPSKEYIDPETLPMLYEGSPSRSRSRSLLNTSSYDLPLQNSMVKTRLYYMDWLRCLAIFGAMFVHSLSDAYAACELTREKNPEFTEMKDGLIRQFAQMGLPLMFYISGVSASFYDTF